jgi:hypothetical protein
MRKTALGHNQLGSGRAILFCCYLDGGHEGVAAALLSRAKTGLHPLTGPSVIAPVDNAERRLASRERHVVGDDRLGETLQGERANLFSRYAFFERHVDALSEQNLAVLGLAAEPCVIRRGKLTP